MERLRADGVESDLTTFQRQQLEHGSRRLRNNQIGFGPTAAPSAAPAAPSGGGGMASAPADLAPVIAQAAQANNIPAPLLTALFQQESQLGRDPRAAANGGGVAQIISSTARDPGYGVPPISDADRLDPNKAIPWAAQYLAARNPGVDWNDPAQRDAALRRYNGGGDPNYAANVTRHLGGTAARTGGTDVAGPGAGTAPAAAEPRMLYKGNAPFTDGLPSGQAWGQAPDGRRVAMDIPGARQPQGRGEAAGPIGGNGLDSALLNILLTGDPGSPQYAAAYARLGAEEVLPNGNSRRPDMSPFRAPTYRPPGVMEPAPAAPATAPAAAAPPAPGAAPAAPQAPAEPQIPQGGRSYGRAETTQVQQVTPQAREAVRKVSEDVTKAEDAIRNFLDVHRQVGGGGLSTYFNDPTSPQAQRLLGAFETMKTALRSEAFLNTGVLQPAEASMLDDTLLSPGTARGAMATSEAVRARLDEIQKAMRRGLSAARQSAGLDVQGPSPGSTAEPSAPGYSARGPQADPLEGRTITNGSTGARMIRRNGKWEAL
jgi:hypothetical protein